MNINMNKCFFTNAQNYEPNWRVFDASGQVLGRLATKIADGLSGKDKPEYTPHHDSGDYIVVINCEKIVLTGDKWDGKIYRSYSGWRGGLKEVTAEEVFKKDPRLLIEYAVERMLPKSRLGRQMFKKLKVYVGDQHPHKAQVK